jgi:ubiquitin related modifier 1
MVRVELGGGLEALFGGHRSFSDLQVAEPTVQGVLEALVAHASFDTRRRELLLSPGSTPQLRPGIIVLVNDADWELTGGYKTALATTDTVLFISTLHGG